MNDTRDLIFADGPPVNDKTMIESLEAENARLRMEKGDLEERIALMMQDVPHAQQRLVERMQEQIDQLKLAVANWQCEYEAMRALNEQHKKWNK